MDTVYKESAIYVPADDLQALDLKTGERLLPVRNNGGMLSSAGPVNGAIQIFNKIVLQLIQPYCFDRPSICLQGLTVAFWIKLPDHKLNRGLFLRPRPTVSLISPQYFSTAEGVGIGAYVNDELHAGIEIYVSSQTHRCFYEFPVATQAWNHVSMVWLHREAIKVFLNGHRLPGDGDCSRVQDSLESNKANRVRFGIRDFSIWLDEFVKWNKALSDNEAMNIYYQTNTGNACYKLAYNFNQTL